MAEANTPLLGAVLIVKDEAAIIEHTLRSLVKARVDAVTVLDTGSTDGTQAIVRKFCGGAVARFHLAEEAPVMGQWGPDFAWMRNRVMEIARERNRTEWTVALSGDELVDFGDLRAVLAECPPEVNALCALVYTNNQQQRAPFPRILRTDGGWRWINRTANLHETPEGPAGERVPLLVKGCAIVHQGADKERKMRRLRERDLPALTAAVEDDSQPLVLRAEAIYQLAETHFVLGHNEPRDEHDKHVRGGRFLSHIFSAMALYARFAELVEPEDSVAHDLYRAMYAHTMYCHAAELVGLFEPTEIVKRMRAVCAAPEQPVEAHWLLAKNAAKIDPRKGLPLLLKVAKAAHEAQVNPHHGATDVTLEWQALRMAAWSACVIKDKRLMHDLANRALAAGAPSSMVEEWLPETSA